MFLSRKAGSGRLLFEDVEMVQAQLKTRVVQQPEARAGENDSRVTGLEPVMLLERHAVDQVEES